MSTPSFVVDERGAGSRLHDLLRERMVAVPVGEVGPLVVAGRITVNGLAVKPDARLADGDRLEWDAALERDLAARGRFIAPWEEPVATIHEDDVLIVAIKPAGLHVHPIGRWRDRTLLNALVWRAGARPGLPFGSIRPHPAHRLDRSASGLIAIAKGAAARDHLRRALGEG